MAYEDEVSSGGADQLNGAKTTRAASWRQRRTVTPMGVLEVLMWCVGAGAILGFWLWPRTADAPVMGNTPRPHVAVAFPTFTEQPADPTLGAWQERFRAATGQAARSHAPDADLATAESPAAVADAATPGALEAAPVQTSEPEIERPAAVLADNQVERPDDEVDSPGAASVSMLTDPSEPSADAELQSLDASVGRTAVLDSMPADTHVLLPPDIPSLDLLGLPQIETASDLPDSLVLQFASSPDPVVPETSSLTQAEPPQITVPDVEMVLADAIPAADQDASALQRSSTEQASVSVGATPPVDRDAVVAKGEELLIRGDIAAARLFFGRAAANGDWRGAVGMARTFDPETFRNLRVFGIRPDPEQAAQWYSRSKVLQAVASGR